VLQVNISVLDVNDNDPMFSSIESRVSFREDVPVGTLIYIARARDQDSGGNAVLTYSTPGDVERHFELDRASGHITLRSPLDAESSLEHRINIVAQDSGTPPRSATMSLVVSVLDANDNPPVFPTAEDESYLFRVSRPVPLGARIGLVGANDSDAGSENSRITYYLRNGRLSDLFDVSSGEIRTKVVLGHDRGRNPRYLLEVVASDGGVPALSATATVLISLYDGNRDGVVPTFMDSRYVFNVTENQPVGSKVGCVTSQGVDDVEYFLLSSSSSARSYFSVGARSGEILSTRLLDREDVELHRSVFCVREN